jgi:hypothetical protein
VAIRIEFHKFTELATGKPVIVNPSQVRCIRQADAEDHALIEFGDDHVVAVTASADDVVAALTTTHLLLPVIAPKSVTSH